MRRSISWHNLGDQRHVLDPSHGEAPPVRRGIGKYLQQVFPQSNEVLGADGGKLGFDHVVCRHGQRPPLGFGCPVCWAGGSPLEASVSDMTVLPGGRRMGDIGVAGKARRGSPHLNR